MPTTYAIPNGATQFAATTYTGNGTSQSIVNAASTSGASFQPDLVWLKSRSSASWNHFLQDTVRGLPNFLISSSTAAETTTSPNIVSAVNSNGFSVLANGNSNTNTDTYVGWQWKASNAAAVTNTAGSISSQVSANTTAGFSIVTYTGTGANATVGHGLGIAPKMVIVKRRNSTSNWAVYQASISGAPDNFLYLNSTSAVINAGVVFNGVTPNSTIFGIGTDAVVNASGGTYVAYCFAEIAGYSKFGSYTGNGATDGTFVYLGFRPRWVMIKRTNATENWQMYDSSRNTSNVVGEYLLANTSGAGATITVLDMVSNGFKIRVDGTNPGVNASGSTYIYAAFAENPFKYANAR